MSIEEVKNMHFKSYHSVWQAISEVVTPEQGWYIFTDCLDISEGNPTEPSNDPIVETFVYLIMYIDALHNQIEALHKTEVHSNDK